LLLPGRFFSRWFLISSPALRQQRSGKNRRPVDIDKGNAQFTAERINAHLAGELKTRQRRGVGCRRCFLEHELRAEGVVKHVRAEAAGIQRAGDKFPERVEFGELRLGQIVVMRGAVMHVGGDPHHVANARLMAVSSRAISSSCPRAAPLVLARPSKRSRPEAFLPSPITRLSGICAEITFQVDSKP